MDFWKNLLKRLLFPHVAIIISLIPISAALLVVAFLLLGTEHPVSYGIYVLSAYTLTVICVRIPMLIAFIKRVKEENKIVNRIVTDAHLRVRISLYSTVYFNLALALFQLVFAILNFSVMFYSLAAYYFLLALMRMYLLGYTRKHDPGENMIREYKRYRFCGVCMLFLNIALSVIITYTVLFETAKNYGMIVTISMAAFSFTALTVAIVNVVRYKRYNSPVFTATKDISLAVAVVSMLSLETSMFAAFEDGKMNEGDIMLMMALTGFAVMAFVLGLAIFMIVRSSKGLKSCTDQAKNNTTNQYT
jgi:heme exporter protein D